MDQNLYTAVVSKKAHRQYRHRVDWDLAGEYAAAKLPPIERMIDRFERLCREERPVLLPGEQICYLRTVANLPPVFTEDEWADIRKTHYMLGSDPIYQYDLGLSTKDGKLCPSDCQHVVTLEPVYYGTGGGGDPRWVDWYLQENFAPGVGFNYTQAGQENSFGWEGMKAGLEYQFCKLAELEKTGVLRMETLLESGQWFKAHFPVTPPTSIGAMSDWKNEGRRTLWYESRFYRANFYQENGQVWLRDIYTFDETYPERYLTERCTSHQMVYDTLPVIDGNRWSGGITRAGLYPMVLDEAGTAHPLTGTLTAEYPADGQALVRVTGEDGELTVLCTEDRLHFTYAGSGRLVLELRDGVGALAAVQIEENRLAYTHNGFDYTVELPRVGDIRRIADGICLEADGDTVEMAL